MTDPLSNIKLAPRAIRDLKNLDRQTRKRVQQAFQALGQIPRTSTSSQWLDTPLASPARRRAPPALPRTRRRHRRRYLVARVIDRRDLHRAIDKL
jgi:hypothetical protein